MLTPQEVSSKTFPKAVMGGYGMAAVDDFLDKLTEDYTTLFQENTALKNKAKQLSDEIDRYRKVDEQMRATLLAAQEMAEKTVAEAEAMRAAAVKEIEEKRAALMGDAEKSAKERMAELKQQMADEEYRLAEKKAQVDAAIAGEELRLEKARAAVAKFMEIAKGNCQEQMKILERLQAMVPAVPVKHPARPEQPKAEEPQVSAPQEEEVPSIPEMAAASEAAETEAVPVATEPAAPSAEEPAVKLDEDFFTTPLPSMSALRERVRQEMHKPEVDHHAHRQEKPAPQEEPPVSVEESIRNAMEELKVDKKPPVYDDDEATRVINLNDLQFGRNYKRGE